MKEQGSLICWRETFACNAYSAVKKIGSYYPKNLNVVNMPTTYKHIHPIHFHLTLHTNNSHLSILSLCLESSCKGLRESEYPCNYFGCNYFGCANI